MKEDKMKINKLVRDKIPELIEKDGVDYKIHKADDKEYWEKLKEKLLEEVKEFIESESIEELADIQEVLNTIMLFKNIDSDKVFRTQIDKREERGGFLDRIILTKIG